MKYNLMLLPCCEMIARCVYVNGEALISRQRHRYKKTWSQSKQITGLKHMVSLYSRKSQNFQVFLLLFMTRRWYAWNFCLNQDCLYTLLPSSHSTIYCLCSTLADSAANSIELPKFLVYGVIHSLLCNLYLQCSIKWASLDFWQHYSVKNVPIFFRRGYLFLFAKFNLMPFE